MNWCKASWIGFAMNSRFAPWIALKGIVVKSIYFFVYRCSYHKLGDLSTTLEMTVHSQLFFTRKDDLSRRFIGLFQTLWMTGLRWKLFICVNLVHSNDTAFLLCSFYTITLLITLVFPCFSKGNVFYHPHTILSPSTFLSLFYFLFFTCACYNMLYLTFYPFSAAE